MKGVWEIPISLYFICSFLLLGDVQSFLSSLSCCFLYSEWMLCPNSLNCHCTALHYESWTASPACLPVCLLKVVSFVWVLSSEWLLKRSTSGRELESRTWLTSTLLPYVPIMHDAIYKNECKITAIMWTMAHHYLVWRPSQFSHSIFYFSTTASTSCWRLFLLYQCFLPSGCWREASLVESRTWPLHYYLRTNYACNNVTSFNSATRSSSLPACAFFGSNLHNMTNGWLHYLWYSATRSPSRLCRFWVRFT